MLLLYLLFDPMIFSILFYQGLTFLWRFFLWRKSNQHPSHPSSTKLQPHNPTSIGNHWETGKTWSPGTRAGDQYQQDADVRKKEGKKTHVSRMHRNALVILKNGEWNRMWVQPHGGGGVKQVARARRCPSTTRPQAEILGQLLKTQLNLNIWDLKLRVPLL